MEFNQEMEKHFYFYFKELDGKKQNLSPGNLIFYTFIQI